MLPCRHVSVEGRTPPGGGTGDWRPLVEITGPLELDESASHLIEMHSVYNVLNVVVFRIDAVGYLVGDPLTADRLMDQVLAWHAGLGDRERTLYELRKVPALRAGLVEWMGAQRDRVEVSRREELEQHIENLESIFSILEARVAELVRRTTEPRTWGEFSLAGVRANFESAFRAIEKNSFGRWRIAFSQEEWTPGAYLMELDLRSRDGVFLSIPAVLEDVTRDLAANARKYTDPGGRIGVVLAEESDGVLLEVTDTGRGIPADEIEDVVRFGRRGSNQGEMSQPGGGFGLTKACHFVQSFRGRMWIRSAPGAGTTVTIRIPHRVA